MQPTPTPTGFFEALRRLADTFLAMVQNRLELIAVEWREEKSRAVAVLIACALGLFLVFMSVITVTFLLVVAFWQNAVWVLLALSIFYVGGAVAAFLFMRSRLKAPFFGETLEQIKKDRQWLFSRK